MVGHCAGGRRRDRGRDSRADHRSRRDSADDQPRDPDPECDVDIVANEAREGPIDCALSMSLAFGGNNAALVLRAV